jgi:hypothetical protein
VTGPTVDLRPPPEDLSEFPAQPAGRAARTLYRIFFNRDRHTGALNSPWRFTSVPPGTSRFDLPEPNGTCYWSDHRYGAFIEVFRGARMIDRQDVTRRRLFTAVPPELHLADTTAAGSYRFGITAELSTVVGYALPQAWADVLHRAGFAGLIGLCRHDPTQRARNVAVFGPAGTPARRAGWRTRRELLENDVELAVELAELGVRIAPVPFTVPTVPHR